MKKIFTIIVLAALSLTAMAQQKKVAVYVTGEDSGINKVLGDQLVDAFTKSGKYTAVERSSSFLAEIGKEQGYQRTGAVSDREIAKIGVQFGVNLVCVADVSEIFGKKYVSARLIDVETAEVVNTANETSQLNSMEDLLSVSKTITSQLASKTAKELADGKKAIEDEHQKKEQMLIKAFEDGFIEVQNLYVSLYLQFCSDVNCVEYATQQCRLGGYYWRVCSSSELSIIRGILAQYINNASNYPIVSSQLVQLGNINKTVWTKDVTKTGPNSQSVLWSAQDPITHVNQGRGYVVLVRNK